MKKKTVEDIDLAGKRALVRTDYNVPMDSNRNITDDIRIRSTLPTINHILDAGGSVILMSHLGRPKGKVVPEMSLAPVAKRLGRLLQQDVPLAPDCIGDETERFVEELQPGEVLLLENLRFHPGEANNDPEFSRRLASLGDVYVDEAFANAHRQHASMIGVPELLKPAVAGFLVKSEITYFHKSLEDPVRPLAAIFGGAKVSDKIKAIMRLLEKVDKIIIGGGMAYTFLESLGYCVGRSLVEKEMLELARDIMDRARQLGVPFYLPVDAVAAKARGELVEARTYPAQEIPDDCMGLDIGPATIALFRSALEGVRTIVWNGPMGVFELSQFSKGTFSMVDIVAQSPALTILGGGDTDVAVHATGNSEKIDYISTGGGAFLKLLETGELQGINALDDR
ncbi:phosphoglycerate kinase [bacterium]|nr:MAG: phosphoglycerate kinase [bacterium]